MHSNPPADFSDDSLSRFLDGLTDPVHVLVTNSSAARREHRFAYHTCSTPLPPKSLINVGGNVYVCSPELCFVHLAALLPPIELIALGYELCGTYSISTAEPKGFVDRKPLTDLAKLETFIKEAKGVHGVKVARQNLQHILSGAASPRETAQAMLFCLPYTLGGYALPKPYLNHRIISSKHVRQITGQKEFFCDAYWPPQKLAVEYDSDQYHTGSERIAHDSKRRNALTDMGITMITVTRKQINSSYEIDKVAQILARRLGKRIQPRCENYRARQQKLRATVL